MYKYWLTLRANLKNNARKVDQHLFYYTLLLVINNEHLTNYFDVTITTVIVYCTKCL